jgi:hypothetical protein
MTALLAASAVVAAAFLALGSAKVLALAPMRARAAHLGYSTRSYQAIGALEVAGAVGVLVGLALPPIGALAGAGLLLLLAGAVVAHLRNGDRPRLLAPALVAALLVAAYLVTLLGARP